MPEVDRNKNIQAEASFVCYEGPVSVIATFEVGELQVTSH